jgi:integration host factor subunit beta
MTAYRVTKSELIEMVAQRTGMTKGRAEMVVSTIFDSMTEALARGDGIEIRGFGSFTVRQYKAYEGRNPRTGDVVHVPPKKLPFFKVGKDLRERVNGKGRAVGTKTPAAPRPERKPTSPRTSPSRRRDDKLSEDVI